MKARSSQMAMLIILLLCLAGSVSAAPTGAGNFTTLDNSTLGNWQSQYGADGYLLALGTQKNPPYATVSVQDASTWTWAAPTGDARALSSAATCWYSPGSFSFNVSITDGNSHGFSIYAVDWDNQGRKESISITDTASGTVLDTRTITGFSNGIYLVGNISGTVTIVITTLNGPNAVASGIFFGGTASAGSGSTSQSEIAVDTGNGFGSVGQYARRFLNTDISAGSDITYTQSSVSGDFFKINTPGVYSISDTDFSTNGDTFSISLNSDPATEITNLTAANRLCSASLDAGHLQTCAVTLKLSAGDIIRAHRSIGAVGATDASPFVRFVITKVAD